MKVAVVIAVLCFVQVAFPGFVKRNADGNAGHCNEVDQTGDCSPKCQADDATLYEPMQCCNDQCACVDVHSGEPIEGTADGHDCAASNAAPSAAPAVAAAGSGMKK